MQIPENRAQIFEETIFAATLNGLAGGAVGHLAVKIASFVTEAHPSFASYATIVCGSLAALRVITKAKLPPIYKGFAITGLGLTSLLMTATVIATANPIKETLLLLL